MVTKTQLTADQKVRIVAAILKLQNGQPTDKANNPYRFIRYREVAKEIALRDIATPTLRNILSSLSIEPRSSGKVRPTKRTEITSIRTKNVVEIKDKLLDLQVKYNQLVTSTVAIEKSIESIFNQLNILILNQEQLKPQIITMANTVPFPERD